MGSVNVSIAYNPKLFVVSISKGSYIYDGKVKTLAVTIKYNGKTVKKSAYTLKWSGKRINVGTYTLKVTPRTKMVKKSALKTKALPVALAKLITIKKPQGAVKYKLISKHKSLTYNSGKKTLTLKKGAGKGTYKAKFNVTAAGNKNYEKAEKAVTVKIQVK